MSEVKSLIEAALFASGRALSAEDLARICGSGSVGLIRRNIEELVDEYKSRRSGIALIKIPEGYIMQVKTEYESAIMPLVPETEIPLPVLKTLALIAYEKQIKQSDLVKERGSGAYAYVKFLKKQGLIEAKREGRTKILSVTPKFRAYFHVEDLEKLVPKEKTLKDYGAGEKDAL